ncbi:hypothetical protein APHAL10511_001576 [Amanita phalloides]|nr:hypothetical protein APHAL10511_001576 [Amanita phalloides]
MGQLTDLTAVVYSQLTQRAATEQGGVISGSNPSAYNVNDPFQLWVIQVALILAMTQLLSFILGRLRQPRVVAEIIGGVLLGPTAMGRIPGFTAKIFPPLSIQLLTLTSTIGLVFFLFLVGLELDTRVLKRNWANSVVVSVAGLVIPLGAGAALAIGIYHEFIDPAINFGHFSLFVAVAVGITAFPVLCRIMVELKLLDTPVGIVALSAGVGNDVVGWVLLALTVALINASSGLTALWVLLASVGYALLLLYPGRWAYVWLARRTGSLERGTPNTMMMTVTLFVVLISAFYTDIIGVHPIFGGFLAGLIIPHENGYGIALVEKLEDLICILFLPIYFALSGLRTNLGLLDNGITWGYTILTCTVAFSSKFLACSISGKLSGFNWRESGAIGSLMACKGLVELIVLNIGLQAGILDTRVFSMFVVHAIILTCLTTPLVLLFYPAKYRVHEHGSDVVSRISEGDLDGKLIADSDYPYKNLITVVLDRLEQVPAAMIITKLLKACPSSVEEKDISEKISTALPVSVSIDAVRLMEISGRTSAVLRSTESEALLHEDSITTVYRTFGHLNCIPILPSLVVANYDEYPIAIAEHVERSASQLVIVPWSSGHHLTSKDVGKPEVHNPFESIFHRATSSHDTTSSIVYSEYVRKVFHHSPVDVALFIDHTPSKGAPKTKRHLFLPFFGGPDDRLALAFVVQLCMSKDTSATVIRLDKIDKLAPLTTNQTVVHPPPPSHHPTLIHQTMAAADTHYGEITDQHRMVSDTTDNLLWDKFVEKDTSNASELAALSSIRFVTKGSPALLHTVAEEANELLKQDHELTIVLGRSRRMATESHAAELREIIAECGSSIGASVAKTLGDVGASLLVMNVNAGLLVMQAHSSSR